MTTYYYGVNHGANEYQATVDTSTTSKTVEVTVNGAVITDKESLLLAVEKLTNFIVRSTWPPV